MAPHDTNTPKEARRHAFPLLGIATILVIVAVGFFLFVGSETEPPATDPAAEQQEQPVEPTAD